jgi:hypothetical protein
VSATPGPRIFRVLIEARDLRESQRFYEALFAGPGRPVGGGRVYFDCGPVIFAIVDRSAEGPGPVRTSSESLYFATEDLEGMHRRAAELGCLSPEFLHDDPASPLGEIVVRPWGERSFYAADPSGNPLCFVDAGTLFTGAVRPPARSARPSRTRPPVGRTRAPSRRRSSARRRP